MSSTYRTTVGTVTVLPVQYRHFEVKTPLDIYLQRHSPLLPGLWLRYSPLSTLHQPARARSRYHD